MSLPQPTYTLADHVATVEASTKMEAVAAALELITPVKAATVLCDTSGEEGEAVHVGLKAATLRRQLDACERGHLALERLSALLNLLR